MTNVLEPRSIGELTLTSKNYRFFIPSYQRGYRWGKDEVSALLNDLLEFLIFSENKKEKYCLQPIVVKELPDGRYEVLDGQQRLTTLYILLSYLRQSDDEVNLFSLQYETRTNSEAFLQNLTTEINSDNPDYFYISQAYGIISNWFTDNGTRIPRLKRKITDIVLEQVDIIWYEIKEESNPIDVFTRINIGKIPLTNSELVKAIFLSKNNLQLGLDEDDQKIAETILNNKQSVIALEWDAMQKQLQDDKFWAFIYNKKENNYQTRIDYILDLVTESPINKKDSLESFNTYYDKIKEVRSNPETVKELEISNTSFIEKEWSELKAYFDILLEWYNNKWYNHIIGFLISRNENVIELLKKYKDLNRDGFKSSLLNKIKDRFLAKKLSALSYESNDKKTIESILLLYNVVSSLLQPDTSIQFPFDQIRTNKWSLEHIYAQNSEDLKEKDIPLWIHEHLQYFQRNLKENDTELVAIIESLKVLSQFDISNGFSEEYKELFTTIFSDIDRYNSKKDEQDMKAEALIEEADGYQWITDDQSIANLTLLDVGSNSYLSNSIFGVKREKIKELDKIMAFIPNETRKVFFKYYSDTVWHDAYWTLDDRKAYVKDIESKVYNLNNLLEN
ncbi:uncharacterized protein CHSO_3632 [Chryseobacterium sp. StRB126]|uniref:DUF262 domain-containing protein n=1 Tax=Chryseobacterium sp. StRB126 TaxID=878220 RepID=UPI0004E98700|nr:DUF262 domain-containing protein [Chryseobacterium sp. StRB126]BAP32669.1 uncharacterized protein CHSO_3632 [Chryseobacterium sp. StRB126]